jgi:hypothetical protein
VKKQRIVLASGLAVVLLAAGLAAYLGLGETPHHAARRRIRLGLTEAAVAGVVADLPDRDLLVDGRVDRVVEFERLVDGVPRRCGPAGLGDIQADPVAGNTITFAGLGRYHMAAGPGGSVAFADRTTRSSSAGSARGRRKRNRWPSGSTPTGWRPKSCTSGTTPRGPFGGGLAACSARCRPGSNPPAGRVRRFGSAGNLKRSR